MEAPSAWTTALIAGGLALLLTLILTFIDPPPEASLQQIAAPAQGVAADKPSPLTLEIRRLVMATPWDQLAQETWESVPLPPDAVSPAIADGWNNRQPRQVATASLEPPYLRTEVVDLQELPPALEASDIPEGALASEALCDAQIVIERTDAAADQEGTVAYTLTVRNAGPQLIGHVRLIETIPLIEHVVDTDPPAAITPEGALVWQLADLQPAEERQFVVRLDAAQATMPFEGVAVVDVESRLAVRTAVLPAALAQSAGEPAGPQIAQPEEPIPSLESAGEPPLTQVEPAPASPDWSVEPVLPSAVEDTDPILPLLADEVPASDEGAIEPIEPELSPFDAPPQLADANLPVWPEEVQPNEPEVPSAETAPEPAPATPPGWNPTPRPLPLDPARPPRPVLNLASQSDELVQRGEIVTTVFEVVNAGDVPAEGIVLTVHVPPELRHKHGELVEHRIERLEPGEKHRARLYTRASAVGTAHLGAVLSHEGGEEQHVIEIRVLGARQTDGSAAPSGR